MRLKVLNLKVAGAKVLCHILYKGLNWVFYAHIHQRQSAYGYMGKVFGLIERFFQWALLVQVQMGWAQIGPSLSQPLCQAVLGGYSRIKHDELPGTVDHTPFLNVPLCSFVHSFELSLLTLLPYLLIVSLLAVIDQSLMCLV